MLKVDKLEVVYHRVITDRRVQDEMAASLRERGIEVIVA